MLIKNILDNVDKFDNKKINIKGWLSANRGNKKIRFLEINDGSSVESIQIVVSDELDFIESINLGSSIEIVGLLKKTPNHKQVCEVKSEKITLLSEASPDYLIQKNEINMETLREYPHIRHRTNTIRSIMLIRSTLSQELHNFFNEKDFLYMHSPIITSNDGEGAGESFTVTSENNKNFFPLKSSLTVTGQLHAESYANGFSNVYTFGPTFRAENSNTKRHAAEFWMLEPEVAFAKLHDVIELADSMLKTVIKNTINKRARELKYLDDKNDNKLINNLNKFIDNKIQIIEYKDAISILQKQKDVEFEFNDIKYGIDLATEHEKYLCDIYFKAPVAVINYPKEFKAFYMYLNDDKTTVAAFDLLVPGIGELIGGSQRETRLEILNSRMDEFNIPKHDLQWYLDLRKYGNFGSAGFGLGFERLVMYVTGADNIRDVIPYPRNLGNLKM